MNLGKSERHTNNEASVLLKKIVEWEFGAALQGGFKYDRY